ncbi:MAG: 2,3-bisphosphoglycerate-independent phosphoglycerate mutase [Nanoarchaeota archaeon]
MRKVLLIIRDGWGEGPDYDGNAITHANIPNHRSFVATYPTTLLQCTGNAVGNPEGVQGGSEVGHLTMGAGRVVWQPYEMINQAIKSGEFFRNEALLSAITHCKEHGTALHLSGLFSGEGVHADWRHMAAILRLCEQQSYSNVFIHLCLDGRDVPERSALGILAAFQKEKPSVGTIASVFGRYFGMDRDTNWDRTRKAYDAMAKGEGFKARSAEEAIKMAYERGDTTDYYVQPTVIVDEKGSPLKTVQANDSFIWYNFRSDRSRQITAMLIGHPFCPVQVPDRQPLFFVCMCKYDDAFPYPVAFLQNKVKNNLGQAIASKGLRQLRIAETEKFAHVTFFFNSQVEQPNPGEDHIMVPSPKVLSYDLQPEMSAYGIRERLVPALESEQYSLIVCNFANPDLVGHSGVFPAVVKACEVVDECVGAIVKAALAHGYTTFLTADHGNADHKKAADGSVDPSHGTNPVLLTIISTESELCSLRLRQGGQQDVAPTILKVMGIQKPKEMTGEALY